MKQAWWIEQKSHVQSVTAIKVEKSQQEIRSK